jgi:hypothetical protein
MTEIRYLSGIEEISGDSSKKERRKEKIKKIARISKKVAFATLRNSFLTLLRLNFLGLASNLADNEIALKRLIKIWQKLGGNDKILMRIVESGKDRNPLISEKILIFLKNAIRKFKSGELRNSKLSGIYGEPMTLAALITSSIPLIIKVIDLLAVKKEKNESYERKEEENEE